MAPKWGAQVEFRTCSPINQLGHATSVATFKARVAPKRGNDAGLGPPGATAHQEVVFQVQVGRCWPRQELKEKLSATVCVVAKVCLIRRGQGQSQLGQVRQGGRFHPRESGAPICQELRCDDGVEKMADCEGDKCAKSAVESWPLDVGLRYRFLHLLHGHMFFN